MGFAFFILRQVPEIKSRGIRRKGENMRRRENFEALAADES